MLGSFYIRYRINMLLPVCQYKKFLEELKKHAKVTLINRTKNSEDISHHIIYSGKGFIGYFDSYPREEPIKFCRLSILYEKSKISEKEIIEKYGLSKDSDIIYMGKVNTPKGIMHMYYAIEYYVLSCEVLKRIADIKDIESEVYETTFGEYELELNIKEVEVLGEVCAIVDVVEGKHVTKEFEDLLKMCMKYSLKYLYRVTERDLRVSILRSM